MFLYDDFPLEPKKHNFSITKNFWVGFGKVVLHSVNCIKMTKKWSQNTVNTYIWICKVILDQKICALSMVGNIKVPPLYIRVNDTCFLLIYHCKKFTFCQWKYTFYKKKFTFIWEGFLPINFFLLSLEKNTSYVMEMCPLILSHISGKISLK